MNSVSNVGTISSYGISRNLFVILKLRKVCNILKNIEYVLDTKQVSSCIQLHTIVPIHILLKFPHLFLFIDADDV